MGLVQHKRNDQALNNARRDDVNGENRADFAITPKAGRTTLRVMPAWSEKGVWFHEITEHFINGKNRSFPCVADQAGRCPICEHGASLAAQGQEEQAKSFRASTKYLINVLVLNDPNGKLSVKDGVKVMKLATTVKKALLDLDTDTGGGYGDITDYFRGFNINLDKAGLGLNTKYTVKPIPQRIDIIATLQAEGLNPESFQLVALDQFVPAKTYEELANEFGALMSDAPAAQPVPVAMPVPRPAMAGVPAVAHAGVPMVTGFSVPTGPKVNVMIAPPTFPVKGN